MSSAFAELGAQLFAGALGTAGIQSVAGLFGVGDRPGKRLSYRDPQPVAHMLRADGPVGRIAVGLIGAAAKPVRALLLHKSGDVNWRLGWHQDRTIAVDERIEVDGFGRWSVKAGQLHVQPPPEIMAAMATLRVHIDDVDGDNAPLEIIPGSHSLGRLSNDAVDRLAADVDSYRCIASAGDIWAYPTAVVHRSSEQLSPGRRRVLQIDFSAQDLPGGLKWMTLI